MDTHQKKAESIVIGYYEPNTTSRKLMKAVAEALQEAEVRGAKLHRKEIVHTLKGLCRNTSNRCQDRTCWHCEAILSLPPQPSLNSTKNQPN